MKKRRTEERRDDTDRVSAGSVSPARDVGEDQEGGANAIVSGSNCR